MSQPGSQPLSWPAGFIPGIGRIPGGPRVRSRTTIAGDTEIQISTGSTVFVPKREHQDLDLAMLPTFKQPQESLNDTPEVEEVTSNENGQRLTGTLQDAAVKIEETAENIQDLPEDYQNNFARQLAAYRAAPTNEYSRSTRQKVYHVSIRDRTDHAHVSISRDRSRSPTRSTFPNARRVLSASPMFLPEAGRPYDCSLGIMSRSPDSRIRNSASRRSLSITSTQGQDPPFNDEYDESRSQCRCPVSYKCEHRSANLLDCRPLVREWISWKDREDQEAFDRYVHTWLIHTR